MSKKGFKADDRARVWTIVVYPESAPPNWRDTINSKHIAWVESPLHDADTNPDGIKKAHWHIMLMYDGKKSFEQIKAISDEINAPRPEKVHNPRSLVRYMAHLDDPDKHQYNVSDIIAHGGADIASLLKPTHAARHAAIAEMREWVASNKCSEFYVLFDYAALERPNDWLPLLCDNSAYIMGQYIQSRRNAAKQTHVAQDERYLQEISALRNQLQRSDAQYDALNAKYKSLKGE